MCEADIHPGLAPDPNLSRRAFGLISVAAAGAATAAQAAMGVTDRDVTVETPDGMADCVLAHPEGKGPWPAVLIWTDIFGLRPVFRQMARRLAADGYVVLVPNPYYRAIKGAAVGPDFDFSKPEDRAKLTPLRATITPEGTARDAVAFIAYLDAQPQTDAKAKAGTQGYCMGGPLVFQTAAAVPGRVRAGASFHGAGLVSDKPDSPAPADPQDEGPLSGGHRRQRRQVRPGGEDQAEGRLRRGQAAGHGGGL